MQLYYASLKFNDCTIFNYKLAKHLFQTPEHNLSINFYSARLISKIL